MRGLQALLIAGFFASCFNAPSVLGQPSKVDSMTYGLYRKGCAAYFKGDVKGAVGWFHQCLDREKKSPSLSKDDFFVLINWLGSGYGAMQKLDSAEQVFRYGVMKDPTVPMTYYNLACTYSERNNLDSCLAFLRATYKYKANWDKHETFPDPMKDDEFKRFLDNKRFVDAVAAMKR